MDLHNGGAALAVLDIGDGCLAVDLADNLEQHARAARGAYSENTERAFRFDTAVWSTWCSEGHRVALPATPATVAAFVDAMADTRAPATVRRYVSSVAHLHRAADVENPCASDIVKFALKRMHREKGRRQDQAEGVTIALRNGMLAAAPDTLIGKRDKALLATGYDTLLRRSELVALDLADLSPVADDGSATVLVKKSKTDVEGQGTVAFLASDTMTIIQNWLSASRIDGGALFRTAKGGRVGGRMDSGDVSKAFKRLARVAAIAPELVDKISGHSTRVGACQDMSAAGLELGQIMQSGRWKSPEMVARYSEHLAARRGGAARLAAIQGRT